MVLGAVVMLVRLRAVGLGVECLKVGIRIGWLKVLVN